MGVGASAGAAAHPGAYGTLTNVEHSLHDAHGLAGFGQVALGRAPLGLAAPIVSGTMKAALGTADSEAQRAIGHAGLATDGLVKGLVGHHGLMRHEAERRLPFLVTDRAVSGRFATAAKVLGRVGTGLHVGVLGVGGALGVIRAAKAVQGGGAGALLTTQDGRSGALQAIGSALMLVHHPATMLAGAGVFGAAMVNDLL